MQTVRLAQRLPARNITQQLLSTTGTTRHRHDASSVLHRSGPPPNPYAVDGARRKSQRRDLGPSSLAISNSLKAQVAPRKGEHGAQQALLLKTAFPIFMTSALKRWSKAPVTLDLLRILGIPKGDLKQLLAKFVDEMSSIINDEAFLTSDARREEWALDFLEREIQPDSSGKEIDDAIHRVIVSRFLNWVSFQPAAHAGSDAKVADNITTFSPYNRMAEIQRILDMRHPEKWFPRARWMKRKVIMHVGPTNSGKTYNALVALAKAKSGVYLSPLRLLAHEIFLRFNQGQILLPSEDGGSPKPAVRVCNLITGEEQRILDEDAPIESMTVEMCNVSLPMEVAVLDEVQMIGDPQRGSAWTRAILGLQAHELHVCGEETVVDLVKKLLEGTDDEIIVNRYERLTRLTVADHSIPSVADIKPGDCVVAFSRTDIFKYKRSIEKATGLKCAMAYGGLPPEVRAEQAALFNDPASEYSVMVASDAVGMGLNLRIKRIVFTQLAKYDGAKIVPLSTSQVKQIAGRAGRYGLHAEKTIGEATTMHRNFLPYLRKSMQAVVPDVTEAYLSPPMEHVEQLAHFLPPDASVKDIMTFFNSSTLCLRPYRLQPLPDRAITVIHQHMENFPVSDFLIMMFIPLNMRDEVSFVIIDNLAKTYSQNGFVTLEDLARGTTFVETMERIKGYKKDCGFDEEKMKRVARRLNTTHTALKELELYHKGVTAYLWMSYRMSAAFPEREAAFNLKLEVEDVMDYYLQLMIYTPDRKSQTKARYVPVGVEHGYSTTKSRRTRQS